MLVLNCVFHGEGIKCSFLLPVNNRQVVEQPEDRKNYKQDVETDRLVFGFNGGSIIIVERYFCG